MSDFLSQDDIDALLQGNESGELDLGEDAPDTAPTGDFAADVIADFNEQQSVNLNTLVGKEVECSVDDSFTIDSDSVTSKVGDEFVIIKTTLSGGISGVLSVAGSKASFGILADLMVMGDGTAPYNEDSADAVKEMYSTVAGSYATFLGTKCSSSVSSDGVEVFENSEQDSLVAQDGVLVTVTVGDLDPFPLVIALDEPFMKSAAPTYATAPVDDSPSGGGSEDGLLSQDEIDSITTAADDLHSIGNTPVAPTSAGPALGSFSSQAPKVNVDLLLDIDLDVSIELGRTNISIKRVLDLAPGSLVELDRLAGEPVDLLVNDKVVAKGEVVVVDENFGIRIISLVSPEERIKSLK
jgi:flagellar motor switch protein FliN/FliY